MSDITPTFLALLSLLCIAIISVKKTHMIVPIIIAMCFLPADIPFKIGNINFQAIRILALVGFIRVYFSPQFNKIRYNTIDKLFFYGILIGSVFYILASKNTFGAFIYKSGLYIDSIFLYILLRRTLQSKEDIRLAIKIISICVIILLPFTVYEYFLNTNLFSIVGRSAITIREGEVRASGTFSHAILYGSFAAAIVPLLWADNKYQKNSIRIIAILSCLFIIFASQSSGPIIALVTALFFLYFFRWKQYGRILSWFILFSALFIHIARKAPIWHFFYVRVSIKASSTGYHRYLLMDAAVKEFWNWWLLGYGDTGPQWHLKYWDYTHATFTDMTNHYLLEGVRGGFLPMLLFMILCFKSVKILGSYAISQPDPRDQWLWWGFTVTMITHCISFLSVAYFGQITMLFYMTIAVAAYALDESKKQVPIETLKELA